MKFVSKFSGAWNFEILVEDSDNGGPIVIAVRIKCLFSFHFWYATLYNKLDLNTQVLSIYYVGNIYLKLFMSATTLRKWHEYEIITLVNY